MLGGRVRGRDVHNGDFCVFRGQMSYTARGMCCGDGRGKCQRPAGGETERHVACCAFLLGNRRKQLIGDTFSEEFAARFSQKHAAAAAAVSRQSSYLGIAIIAMANRRHRRKLERMT